MVEPADLRKRCANDEYGVAFNVFGICIGTVDRGSEERCAREAWIQPVDVEARHESCEEVDDPDNEARPGCNESDRDGRQEAFVSL